MEYWVLLGGPSHPMEWGDWTLVTDEPVEFEE